MSILIFVFIGDKKKPQKDELLFVVSMNDYYFPLGFPLGFSAGRGAGVVCESGRLS
jgi:hypothetical protein